MPYQDRHIEDLAIVDEKAYAAAEAGNRKLLLLLIVLLLLAVGMAFLLVLF